MSGIELEPDGSGSSRPSEHERVAILHVAAAQLRGAHAPMDVLRVVADILLNFVGATRFALFALDPVDGRLRARWAEGVALQALPELAPGQGVLGRVAAGGPAVLGSPTAGAALTPDAPAIALPLQAHEQTVGVLAVWQLLAHKPTIVDIDRDLFQLLAKHAGSALARLRECR